MKTSDLLKKYHAIAAINGSYYNTSSPYGAATFLREEGTTTATTNAAHGVGYPDEKALVFNAGNTNVNVVNRPAANQQSPFVSGWNGFTGFENMMAGGPGLLTGGNVTYEYVPMDVSHEGASGSSSWRWHMSFYPFTAAGVTANNHLILVTGDGRTANVGGVAGLTVEQVAHLMKALGCTDALKLDGGGSTTMAIEGATHSDVVNYPSDNGIFDHEGERSNPNALLLVPRSRRGSGSALSFDGNDDRVIVPHSTFGNPTGSFSVEGWAKIDNGTNDDAIISKHDNSSGRKGFYIQYSYSSNKLGAGIGRSNNSWGAITASTPSWSANQWHHFAMTYNPATDSLKLYVDGEPAGATLVPDPVFSTNNLCIGGSDFYPANSFKGGLDEIRFWSKELTVAEIKRDMHRNVSVTATGLTAYYKFDEFLVSPVKDYSSNALTGTTNGGMNLHNLIASYAPIAGEKFDGLSALGANWWPYNSNSQTGTQIAVAFNAEPKYLLVAHNNLTGDTTAGIPAALTRRLKRSWLADKFGVVTESMNLSFTTTQLGVSQLDSNREYFLLFSADGNDYTPLSATGTLLANNTLSFNGIAIREGWYTIGWKPLSFYHAPGNRAFEFNGAANIVKVPYNKFGAPAADFSIELWAKIGAGGSGDDAIINANENVSIHNPALKAYYKMDSLVNGYLRNETDTALNGIASNDMSNTNIITSYAPVDLQPINNFVTYKGNWSVRNNNINNGLHIESGFTTETGYILHKNNNQTGVDTTGPVADRQLNRAREAPDQVALVFNELAITYQQLNEQANCMARYLRQAGVKKETLVAICLDQSVEKVISMLAVLKAGGAYIPLDPHYPASRINFILEDTNAPFLLTQTSLAAKLTEFKGQTIYLDTATVQEQIAAFAPGNLTAVNTGADLMYIIYTSGSTGTPKGVMIEHRSVAAFTAHHSKVLGIQPMHKALQFSSTSFDAAVIDLWIPLLQGATLYLYPNNKFIGAHLLDFIRQHQIDIVPLISPTVLSSLPVNEPIGNLTVIGIGGEVCPPYTMQYWSEQVKLFNSYGPTEATVAVTSILCREHLTPKTIGKAAPDIDLYILDEQLREVAHGMPGELFVGGIQIARGYLNRPEITAEKFIKNPFAPTNPDSTRLYRTGDLVRRLPDGNIEFAGRMDDQVKIRGYRIELGEIESALSRLKNVRQAVVLPRDGQHGHVLLVAFIVPDDVLPADTELIVQQWRQTLLQVLPAYMVPDRFELLEKMPVNVHGKIDKDQLHLSVKDDADNLLPAHNLAPEDYASAISKDAQLRVDFNITTTPAPEVLAAPAHLFLTGATGFVGAHLLAELLTGTQATIHCLVRADDDARAMDRLRHTFKKFNQPWHPELEDRIIPVTGDLSLPMFGLDAKRYDKITTDIDVIYHSGSSVSYLQPYPVIKGPNIDGLQEIIRLATTGKMKYLALLSSMGVFSWGRPFTSKTWMNEEDSIEQNLSA
ncbi:AMP-binding enzyme, partial [Ostertagia ostertagi]